MRYTLCMEPKQATSFRLSQEARALLSALARHLGVSQAAVLELLIRTRARQEHLTH